MLTISSESFRDALRHFPSGVTIVTIKAGETVHGLTVSAFASVSPDPPLVAIIIDHRHRAYALLEREGAVSAVNILHQSQIHLSDRLAWVEDKDRILERSWTTTVTGAPGLADPLVWLDCTILGRHRAGTHDLRRRSTGQPVAGTDA